MTEEIEKFKESLRIFERKAKEIDRISKQTLRQKAFHMRNGNGLAYYRNHKHPQYTGEMKACPKPPFLCTSQFITVNYNEQGKKTLLNFCTEESLKYCLLDLPQKRGGEP